MLYVGSKIVLIGFIFFGLYKVSKDIRKAKAEKNKGTLYLYIFSFVVGIILLLFISISLIMSVLNIV